MTIRYSVNQSICSITKEITVNHQAVNLLRISFLCLSILIFLSAASPAAAVGITVNSFDDTVIPGDGNCTLREAIINANSDSDTTAGDCAAGSGPDAIILETGTYALLLADESPDSGPLAVWDALTIAGVNAAATVIDASDLGDRVFNIQAATTIQDVTITGGSAFGEGGGLFVAEADLTLINTIVSGNTANEFPDFAPGLGGGVYLNTGTLTLQNSQVVNNLAGNDGGGIYVDGFSSALVAQNSAISNNDASGRGGGIYNFNGSLTLHNMTVDSNTAVLGGGGILNNGGSGDITASAITNNLAGTGITFAVNVFGGDILNSGGETSLTLANSAISGNMADDDGGGVYNNTASISLRNVTIADNQALSDAGGIDNFGFANFENTIIAGNTAVTTPDCRTSFGWPLQSDGHNLTGDSTGCPTDVTDVTVPAAAVFTAVLGPLQDNGGPTATHALLPGSQAIDAANDAVCPAADQRGMPRPFGPACDIGAYEAGDSPQTGPTFTVNVTDDLDDGLCTLFHCSLREAIAASNDNSGTDVIRFQIPDLFWATIEPLTPLPAVTDPVVISGLQSNSYPDISGAALTAPADGLTIEAGNSTVEGLTLRDFPGSGLHLTSNDGNLVTLVSIYNNDGDGIRISDGRFHTLTFNDILDNGGLGIDLGGDGVTANDVNDPDAGPNDLLNAPVIIRATRQNFDILVEGIYNGLPNAAYTLEFYDNAACDPSGYGEGDLFLGSATVTTNANGNASFSELLGGYEGEGQGAGGFITATATDALGSASEFSRCGEVGPGNDSWPRALALPLIPDEVSPEVLTATYDQRIDQKGQSRWYKFQVQPGSRLIITLTNLPENYDLTVYKDIAATFNDLLTAASPDDLLELGAEFAPDAFSPDAFSPDAFSPDAFSPDAFSPDAFSPDAFSPDAFSPDAFSPDAFSPDAFSPDAFSPDAFSPDAFSPDAFSPDAFSPDAFSPGAFSPDAFSSAQTRSLLGVSAFNGATSEGIALNTWENSGEFYVRVRGRNGAFNLTTPFHLEISLTTGVCNGVGTILPASTHTPTAGGYNTIILADSARMPGSAADLAAMQSSLNALAARPDVNGVIVNVNSDARVVAANAQADAFPTCPFAKNLVAQAVKDIVDGYRELNPLQYVVIVGNDEVIPFFRHPDQALLANERNYVPPVQDNTASQASLKLGYFLSQDRYGAGREISIRADSLPLPDLAVGRLVETPANVIGVIDAYLSTPDGVVSAPSSALVTGYDFLEDAANAVTAELEAGLGATADTLIVPRDLSPQDPAAWTADDLRDALFTNRHDIIYLAGHFSASSALAADYTTRLLASEVAASPVDMSNALIFSAGCHAGYNIVNEHGIPGVTSEPDWAQAFAQKQATLIAGTGYQYGDTDFIEYSERLYLEFSRELRRGTGPVAIGQALVAAKQTYLADTAQLRPIHEKALLEATIFGLPMLRFDLPAGRGDQPGDGSIVGATSGFGSNPGLTLGLQFADVTINPTLTPQQVELTVFDGSGAANTVTAAYLTGADGVVSNPAEPVLPLEMPNVTVPGFVLRGVGFRGGSFSDTADVLPFTGAATTEIRGVHPPFLSNIFYQVIPWRVNYFDALANSGGRTFLAVTPAQYRSAGPVSLTGTLRQFSQMDFRLYYSAYTTQSPVSGNNPALAAPPSIVNIVTQTAADHLGFGVRVVGDPSAGIQEVWVTYTALNGPYAGQWQSLDLTQDPADSTRWGGLLPLNGAPPEDIRFFVQAVNGVGLVGMSTNMGGGFTAQTDNGTAPDAAATDLTLLTPPTSGAYSTSATVSARLTGNGTPLPDQFVVFGLGGQRRWGVTDANGEATVTLALLGLPGDYDLRAGFGGAAVYQPSAASSPFTITRQAASLTFDPPGQTVSDGETAAFTATLTDVGGRPLSEKTVIFIITGGGTPQVTVRITDYAGRAALDVTQPEGSYTVHAYFGGVVPLPDQPLNLEDDRYLSATATASLTVTPAGTAPTIYLSSNSYGSAGNVAYNDEDILAYDTGSGAWSLIFDGSDMGLKRTDIDALALMDDDSILMSFNTRVKLPGLGKVDDSDIVQFIPTSLGEETNGSFELVFDGSDYGLRKGGEDVDAISFAGDGRLIVSANASFTVPRTGGGRLRGTDDDLIVLNASSGDWELYFDGSDVWPPTEDVWGVWLDPATDDVYLSQQTSFTAGAVSGDALDVIVCHPDSLGGDTACTFAMVFDGSEAGFGGNRIDAFAIRR